jgi:putative tryptophan/tyrosine transport system substrate-binding protein
MFTRRLFIAGTLATLARPLAAQRGSGSQAGRVVRVGVLDPLEPAANGVNMEQLRKGLRDAGYVEGKNLVIEYRTSEGRAGRYPRLAAELARLPVDVLIARGTPGALAAKDAAAQIPVVAIGVSEPLETGLVASLERPGGHVTGIAVLIKDLETRRVDVLRALAPKTVRVAGLMNFGNPALMTAWKVLEEAAHGFKLDTVVIDVRKPEHFAGAFDAAKARKADAVVVQLGALDPAQRRRVVELAARHRMPAVYGSRLYVDAGGLVSYGVDTPQLFYRAATFVDKIVKGAKPAELEMEQPTKFELIINRKTVRSLDLVIPPDLLLRSNEIV